MHFFYSKYWLQFQWIPARLSFDKCPNVVFCFRFRIESLIDQSLLMSQWRDLNCFPLWSTRWLEKTTSDCTVIVFLKVSMTSIVTASQANIDRKHARRVVPGFVLLYIDQPYCVGVSKVNWLGQEWNRKFLFYSHRFVNKHRLSLEECYLEKKVFLVELKCLFYFSFLD